MRLLFLSTVYPTPWNPHGGPANRSTVISLRELGCDVRVIAPVPWPERMRARQPVEPAESYPTYWYTPGLFRRYYHRAMWQSIATTLEESSRTFQPDAVLAFWTDPDGTVAVRHAKRLGVPAGVIVGGSDAMLLPDHPPRRKVIAETLQRADHVFAVGEELVRRVVELGVAKSRASNFFCGVDLTRFAVRDQAAARQQLGLELDGPLLLWVGQMVPVKAVDRLITAFAAILEKQPAARLALVGGGALRSQLEASVSRQPALQGRVIFPGPVTHEDLPGWYQAADLFVLPSRSEGVPNVLLESMASGLPFVASDVGSIKDLLPFGPSAVVPQGDITALSDAILKALADPAARPLAPVRHDRLDGARHVMSHLGLSNG